MPLSWADNVEVCRKTICCSVQWTGRALRSHPYYEEGCLSKVWISPRADYLAKTAASYNTAIAYNAIPINRGKKLLEEYYTNIWNAIYINSSNASHTKQFIPPIHYRLSLSLWPNFILTQFLTNHGKFRAYLYKMKKNDITNLQLP